MLEVTRWDLILFGLGFAVPFALLVVLIVRH